MVKKKGKVSDGRCMVIEGTNTLLCLVEKRRFRLSPIGVVAVKDENAVLNANCQELPPILLLSIVFCHRSSSPCVDLEISPSLSTKKKKKKKNSETPLLLAPPKNNIHPPPPFSCSPGTVCKEMIVTPRFIYFLSFSIITTS